MARDTSRRPSVCARGRLLAGLIVACALAPAAAFPLFAQPALPPQPVPEPMPPRGVPLLSGDDAPGSGTPKPTKEEQAKFDRFIGERINPRNFLDLVIGRTTILPLKSALRPKDRGPAVLLPTGGDKIVEQQLLNANELSITGLATGETVLNLWFVDPADAKKDIPLSYLVRVHPAGYERDLEERHYRALENQINQSFPDSVIRLKLVGKRLVLSGQAKDAQDAFNIRRLVQASVPVDGRRLNANVNINIHTQLYQRGEPEASSDTQIERQIQSLLGTSPPQIIDILRVPGVHQVNLHVTVAEVNRTAARSIGVNFSLLNKAGLPVFQQLTGNIAGQIASSAGLGGASTTGGANNLSANLDKGQVQAVINALRNLDFARTLAEPSLTVIDGHHAAFQAGGQFPIPVVTGATATGLQGVEFKSFGVQLSFTPYITDKDLIRLDVNAEVSTRDVAASTTINGATVPGIDTRNFQSVVEMRSGQTLAVAGLIQTNFGADSARVPFFGDLPYIGRLAAFDRTSSGEQEVVILITPELVQPLDGKDCLPLPGDDTFEPTDIEFYLQGRLESRRPEDYRSPVRTDLHRQLRGLHCDDLEIFGTGGYSDGKK